MHRSFHFSAAWLSEFDKHLKHSGFLPTSQHNRFRLALASPVHRCRHANAFSSYLSLPCYHLAPVWSESWKGLIWFWLCHSSLGTPGGVGGRLNSQWLKSCNEQTQTSFFETDVFFFCWQFVKPQRKMQWELGSGMNTRRTRIRFFTWASWHERCTLRSARRTWHECQINLNIKFLYKEWESIGHKPPSLSRYCQIIALLAETLWEETV